jgi:hypothetical protein
MYQPQHNQIKQRVQLDTINQVEDKVVVFQQVLETMYQVHDKQIKQAVRINH